MPKTAHQVPDLAALLPRLEELLGPASGAARPLQGGITNRNYRITLGGEEVVVRLPGKDTELLGISREAERLAGQAAARLGISPEPLATLPGCTVTRFVACSEVSAEDLRTDPREIATIVRAFHDGGPVLPVRFEVPRLLGDYARVVARRGGDLPSQYGVAGEIVATIAAALRGGDEPAVPCHNDLLAANVIRARAGQAGGRLLLVDWEYAAMGDAYFDLGNLSVNNGFDEEADAVLLLAYLGAEPHPREKARLRLMRIVSDAREAAWGVVQGAVSELDFDFAGYARGHFERLSAAAADPRFSQWLGDAAA